MSGSWQCQVCGTVYAWWVAKCREKHEPPPRISDRSRKAAEKLRDKLDDSLGS